jgi:hypothetical protein
MYKHTHILLGILLIVMSIGYYVSTSTNKSLREEIARKEVSYAALVSEVKAIKDKDGAVTYEKPAPELTPEEIVNSPMYKQLDAKTQKYYKDLTKQKGLLASAQAQIAVLKTGEVGLQFKPTEESDSTITFKRGEIAEFSDTTGMLKWSGTVTIDNPVKLSLATTYNPTIQTDFIRQKDKSILVKYKIDDPNATVTKINSVVIPAEKKSTFKKVLDVLIKAGIFAGGYYLGSK